mgnify:CR=1 FL=1
MNVYFLFPIALALAMDVFAVSTGVCLSQGGLTGRRTFRMAYFFGLFQFMMTVLGWAAGNSVLVNIQKYDHWVAFLLLFFIGAKMIYESLKESELKQASKEDPTRGFPLLILSFATSIDALAVGLSFALLSVSVIPASLMIGLVAFLMSLVGVKLAPFLGKIAGKWAELSGGLILIAIGIKILFDHMR